MAEIINKRWEYISFKKGKYILDYFEAPFNNSDSVNFYKNKYRCRPTLNIIFRGLNLEGTISNVNVFEESRCIFKVNCIKFTWFTQYSKLWGNSVHGTVKLEFDNSSIKTYKDVETTQSFINILNFYVDEKKAYELLIDTFGKAFLVDKILEKKGHKKILKLIE